VSAQVHSRFLDACTFEHTKLQTTQVVPCTLTREYKIVLSELHASTGVKTLRGKRKTQNETQNEQREKWCTCISAEEYLATFFKCIIRNNAESEHTHMQAVNTSHSREATSVGPLSIAILYVCERAQDSRQRTLPARWGGKARSPKHV
jgi:hypothetical protein